MKNEMQIKIEGLNLHRLINKLVESNILLNEVKVSKKSLKFKIDEKDYDKLKKIAKREHKVITILSRNGIFNFLQKLPYYFGASLAIFITFTYLFSYNVFITEVNYEYSASFEYDMTDIQNMVYESGVRIGASRFKVDTKDIEKLLLENIDNISGCNVTKNGGSVNILVYPSAQKSEVNHENIYSKFNAKIISAEAYTGNLKVKAGDVVKIGDVLIENNNGAQGKITGIVNFSSCEIYNQNQIKTIKTGNSYKIKNIGFFNKYLYKGKNKSGFVNFIQQKCVFCLNRGYLLPITIEEIVIEEVELKNEIIPFDKVERDIREKLYQETIKKLPECSEVMNVVYSVVQEGDYTRIDCFIETVIDLI